MNNLMLKFDCMAGGDIRNAIEELCIVASRVGCICEADLNGVVTMVKPGSDPRDVYAQWDAEFASKRPYKVVCGHPVSIARDKPWDRASNNGEANGR